MNSRSIVTGIGLLLVMCLLCACAASGVGMTPTESAPENVSVATTVPTNENMATEPATEQTEETLSAEEYNRIISQKVFEKNNRPVEETYAYPFTEEEMAEAMAMAEAHLMDDDYARDIEIHRITYDPYRTDVHIRIAHSNSDVRIPFEERYGLEVQLWVEYSFMPTEGNPNYFEYVSHEYAGLTVSRSSHNGPWEKVDGMHHEELESNERLQEQYALTFEELSQFSFPMGRILGGYLLNDGRYLFYIWDEELQTSRVVKIELPEPVKPEPYDAGLEWDKAFQDG